MRVSHSKCAAGVTLIEVLVVITIAAVILVTASSINYIYYKKQDVKDAAIAADNFFGNARNSAIALSKDLIINGRYQTTGRWCLGLTDNSSGCNCEGTSCTVNGKLTVINNTSKYTNVTMDLTYNPGLGSNFSLLIDKDRGRIIPLNVFFYKLGETIPLEFNFRTTDGQSVHISLNKWGISSICAINVGGYPQC